MDWSKQQQAIFDDVGKGDGNLVVEARAGTGKTTTIVEALGHVPSGETTLMVAFNKGIAKELGEKAPASARVATLHSFGFGAVRRAYPNVRVEEGKTRLLLQQKFPEVKSKMRTAASKLVGLAKANLLPDGDSEAANVFQLDALLDAYWIADFDDERDRRQVAVMALWLIEQSRDPMASGNTIDFDDMVWLPVVHQLSLFRNDRVFVDEAQDLNPCQHVLVEMAVKKYGRLCAIGDSRQAIYGFRGASSNSMQRIETKFGARRLPLSVTYRCPKKVVAAVVAYVPDYSAGENNPEGVVDDCYEERMLAEARPGDFILSRINAPLIKHCLAFIRAGKRATVLGRNIGRSMGSLIEQSNAVDVPALEKYVETWCDKEVQRILRRDPESEIGHLADRRDCMLALCERAETVTQVKDRVNEMFGDGDPKDCIALSSTHRANGLERDRVWMLRDTYLRGKRQSQEEINLFYVACTRSKQELHFVRATRDA